MTMVMGDAEKFVILLAQCGNQDEVADVLGCSRANVSRKLTAARKLLGDERVLGLINLHKRDSAAGVTLRKFFTMESKTCGVCGSAKILQPSGKWRCNACRNARYRAAHPKREQLTSPDEEASDFVILLAKAGNQAEAAKVMGRSQAVVSDRLKKARKTLGDSRVVELLKEYARDESCRKNLMKPFIINKPVCGVCGGEKTTSLGDGTLICRACANRRNEEYRARYPDRISAAQAGYYTRNRAAILARARARDQAWRESNPDYIPAPRTAARREHDRAYYAANAERIKANVQAYRASNKDKIAEYHRHRAATDPAFVAARNARLRAWKKRNPNKVNADTARRQLRLKRAYVAWAKDELIEEFYSLARLRTEVTGIPWEVDHIIPLNSDLVCGLHCEANLQVIPAARNLEKSNRWWPAMPDEAPGCCAFHEAPSLYLEEVDAS